MENNIPNSATEAFSQPIVQPIQPIQQAVAVPQTNSTPIESKSSFLSEINAVEVLVGVVLVTCLFYGIYYYKTQSKLVPKILQEQEEKIAKLDSDIDNIANSLQVS